MSLHLMTNRYSWQEQYEAAILETNRGQRMTRIIAAQNAINVRLREFQNDHGGTPAERQAIMEAIRGLQTLRNDVP